MYRGVISAQLLLLAVVNTTYTVFVRLSIYYIYHIFPLVHIVWGIGSYNRGKRAHTGRGYAIFPGIAEIAIKSPGSSWAKKIKGKYAKFRGSCTPDPCQPPASAQRHQISLLQPLPSYPTIESLGSRPGVGFVGWVFVVVLQWVGLERGWFRGLGFCGSFVVSWCRKIEVGIDFCELV